MSAARDELLKLRTVRMPALLAAASMALALAGVAGAMSQDPDLADPATVRAALAHVGLVSVFALVLGTLAVSGEHRHRTIGDTYLSTPRRERVLAAKLAVNLVAGAALGVAGAVAGLTATAIWFAALGGSLDLWSEPVLRSTLGGIAWCAAFAALGVSVGALVRNTTAALTAALAWVALIEGVVGQVLGDLARWLPFRSGGALGNLPPLGAGDDLSQGVAALALTGYAAVLAVVAGWATVSRDVS